MGRDPGIRQGSCKRRGIGSSICENEAFIVSVHKKTSNIVKGAEPKKALEDTGTLKGRNRQLVTFGIRESSRGDVGICYQPPNQEFVDEVFFKQLKVASKSQDLVLMWELNYLDTCCKVTQLCTRCTANSWSGRNDFLIQMVERLTRRKALLDLQFTNREEWVENE